VPAATLRKPAGHEPHHLACAGLDREIWLTAAVIVHHLGMRAPARVAILVADTRLNAPLRASWREVNRAIAALLSRAPTGPLH